MSIIKLYHGAQSACVESILSDVDCLRGTQKDRGFHMTPDRSIAERYAPSVICFELDGKVCDEMMAKKKMLVRYISNTGNPEVDSKSGMEYVLTEAGKADFYKYALLDCYV